MTEKYSEKLFFTAEHEFIEGLLGSGSIIGGHSIFMDGNSYNFVEFEEEMVGQDGLFGDPVILLPQIVDASNKVLDRVLCLIKERPDFRIGLHSWSVYISPDYWEGAVTAQVFCVPSDRLGADISFQSALELGLTTGVPK